MAPSPAPTPKPWIAAIHAYVPGKAPGGTARPLIKLSANENPLGSSPQALAARAKRGASLALSRSAIAPPCATALGAAARDRSGADRHGHRARASCSTWPPAPMPGRAMKCCSRAMASRSTTSSRGAAGAEPVEAPASDYGTDVDALLAAVTPRTRVVFVANPNNPTGTYLPAREIARLHAGLPADVLLVLDQAYAEYVDPADDDGALDLAASARQRAGHPHLFQGLWPGRRTGRLGHRRARA